jgi:hydrogenase maturation protease
MEASTGTDGGGRDRPVRVLCLGNDLIADDAFGVVVGKCLAERMGTAAGGEFPDPAATAIVVEHPEIGTVEIVQTALSGLYLMDAVVGAGRLIVVDAVVTGRKEPGSLMVLREEEVSTVWGGSPHYVGLFETLHLARRLGLPTPQDVVLVAVEAGDAVTVGGSMTAEVAAAVGPAVDLVTSLAAAAPLPG